MKTGMWTWMRVQFFRFWTALVVLGAYGYFWLNMPEYLTWKRVAICSHILGGTESSRQPVTSGSGCKSLWPS